MISEMQEYYRRRAAIYDSSMGYDQEDVLRKHEAALVYLARRFTGSKLLEIACGPGFWTQFLMKSATQIVATDFNEETLFEARKKNFAAHVELRQADAYDLPDFGQRFDSCFAGDWFCHVPIERRSAFLGGLHSCLAKGALVIFCDQMPKVGATGGQTDACGNNIQSRTLPDGSRYSVIKNFPSENELLDVFSSYSSTTKVIQFPDCRRYAVDVPFGQGVHSLSRVSFTMPPPTIQKAGEKRILSLHKWFHCPNF